MMQQTLEFAPYKLARNTDPSTSHQAAASAVHLQAAHAAAIVMALRAVGPMGKSAIARVARIEPVAVARRMSELKAAGVVRLTGKGVPSDAGRLEREWEAA